MAQIKISESAWRLKHELDYLHGLKRGRVVRVSGMEYPNTSASLRRYRANCAVRWFPGWTSSDRADLLRAIDSVIEQWVREERA